MGFQLNKAKPNKKSPALRGFFVLEDLHEPGAVLAHDGSHGACKVPVLSVGAHGTQILVNHVANFAHGIFVFFFTD